MITYCKNPSMTRAACRMSKKLEKQHWVVHDARLDVVHFVAFRERQKANATNFEPAVPFAPPLWLTSCCHIEGVCKSENFGKAT